MKNYLYKSLALHIAMFILMTLNLSFFFFSKRTDISQVPIIVDLKDVKISEMTNLPPKAIIAEETKAPAVVTKTPPAAAPSKIEEEKASQVEEKSEEKAPVDEPVKEPKQDFLEAPTPEKPKDDKKKDDNKPKASPPKQPKKPTPPKTKEVAKTNNKDPELQSSLKSLLASVNTLEKNLGPVEQQATVKKGTSVDNMGIEGGTGGSYFSQLSISEIDAIAGRLRACWNLDPGAKGAQNMIVEVRAYLNQDGSLKEAKIIDTSRYGSDPHFRAVADSARRAVYNCSPYAIFADKYSDKYDMWKTMLLKFNPLDGNIN